ncbi:MAG: hypothetical protein ACFFA8_10475 [Promethearchaeota archaeon]
MFKCSACGKEYSYGRFLSHECGEHIINHGFLFEDDRKQYEWNPNPIVKPNQSDIKVLKKYSSKDFQILEEEYSKFDKESVYKWNCEAPIEINSIPLSDTNIHCFLLYE